MPERIINVRAFWDAEARVWVAESDDLPGLVTEADDVEQLLAKLKVMIPDLLDELDGDPDVLEIPFSVMLQKLHAKRGPDT